MIRRFREVIYFIVFMLLQTLVINNIRLFGMVTPFLYIYVILKFRIDLARSGVIALSFLLGLIFDIFSNTIGLHAATCTLIGFIRSPLLEQFIDMKELPDHSIPSFRLFGLSKFFRYVLIMVSIHHAMLFMIESFSFYQPWMMFVRMISSILLTCLLVFITESFNLGNKRK